MNQSELLTGLDKVEQIANKTKLGRFFNLPFKYLYAVLHRTIVYRYNKKDILTSSGTFFNVEMDLLLPSSTDIYLTGGKSHASEIALARYMIKTLNKGDEYLDIGAHYGYFSLLASQIVANEGKVIAIEASPVTYKVLQQNANKTKNITAYNFAVSDEEQKMTFYEFPNLYSEYNSLFVGQYQGEEWFLKYKPKEISIQAIKLDDLLLKDQRLDPLFIKIDVEGAEFAVLKGMENFLRKNHPIIAMEYLSLKRGNELHKKAEQFLKNLDYNSFVIRKDGSLLLVNDISKYLMNEKIDSINAIFK